MGAWFRALVVIATVGGLAVLLILALQGKVS